MAQQPKARQGQTGLRKARASKSTPQAPTAQHAVRQARLLARNVDAFLAGRIPKKLYASASSPTSGVIAGE